MKRLLVLLTSAVLIIGTACNCTSTKALQQREKPVYIRVDADQENKLTTTIAKNGDTAPLLLPGQKAYLTMMPREQRIQKFADESFRVEMQKNGWYPMSVTIKSDCPEKHEHSFLISENADMTNAVTITVQSPQIAVYNLKIGTTYFWKEGNSPVYTFTTEDLAPRLIKIDGVPNVRDLGGRKGLNGKRVKQGLVYRSAGLNNNAFEKFKTLDEALKIPKVSAEKKERDAIIERCQKEIASNSNISYVSYCIGNKWTLFRPEKKDLNDSWYAEFGKLSSIPSEFHGAKAESVTADKNSCIVLPGTEAYRPSFFIQEFNAPQDGIIQAGCGGDWFWQIWINGQKVVDLMSHGNFGFPIDVSNTAVEIPVKKGKNIIAVPLLSGSASWTWCIGQPKKIRTHKEMLTKRIEMEKKLIESVLKISDGKQAGKNRLNDEMKRYLTDTLGIKSDIDLRSDGECYGMTGSPAGESVTWFHYSSHAYGGLQSENGKKAFTKVFNVFLDEKNYPIDFHCIAGQDRTGAVAFILNGLLGVEEEQLYLDWESTGFWNKKHYFNHKRLFNHLVAGFMEKVPGSTLHEKIENYVLSLGFKKEDIEHFRSIMLE